MAASIGHRARASDSGTGPRRADRVEAPLPLR